MATIYDVAEAAGVSISTVSHVLNGTRFVAEATKARVVQAMEQLNYRPSSLARALVRQETRTIAFIVPDNVNPFFAEMARGAEDRGLAGGYNVILCNSDRSPAKERAYLDMLISKRVDGVIYMTTDVHPEQLRPLQEQNVPTVVFDREYEGFDALLLDSFQGGYDATSYLLGLGHERIACITGPASPSRSLDRVRGYEAALADAKLAPRAGYIVPGDWTYGSGREAAKQLLALSPTPTAIFACNDAMAVGVLSYLHENGLKAPDDISVVGYDNIALSAYTCPPLTTLGTPILEVGQCLCEMLLERIGGHLPPDARRVTIRGELVHRRSAAAPRHT